MAALRDPAPARTDLMAAVDDELRRYFDTQIRSAAVYGDGFVRLWSLASESVVGGKLLRPMLMLETHHALMRAAGRPLVEHERSVGIATAIELLHFAFLLHDDVIDGDLTRRGRPNLIGAILADPSASAALGAPSLEGSASDLHWARTGGMLMGDLMLANVHQRFARVDLRQADRLRLLDILEHTITESVAGEHLDVALGSGRAIPDIDAVLAMSAQKTATYTFELPLRAAAVLSGADPLLEETLGRAGRHLGIAFQLQDDLLSTFGDPERHGKDPYSDLREGKETAIIAFARTTGGWSSIEASFGRADLTLEEGDRARERLAVCGAEAHVQHLIEHQLRAFREAIADPSAAVPGTVRSVLHDLAARLAGRQS